MSKKIALALSGGIDSLAAGWLLKEKGNDVTGIYLWLIEADGLRRARKAAQYLEIPMEIMDIRKEFQERIIDPFVNAYVSGKTPNPCVFCNAIIKCGILLNWCIEKGYAFLATGHYAQIIRDSEQDRHMLLRGVDKKKDQSYFLYRLTQKQLSHLVLPLGAFRKAEVINIVREKGFNLDTKESQEICFLPSNDYRTFLQKIAPEAFQPGKILDKEGHELGQHYGLPYYTIGQRRGLHLKTPGPFYVIKTDKETNTLIVGREKEQYGSSLIAGQINRIMDRWPEHVLVQIRSTQPPQEAKIGKIADDKIEVNFKKPVKAISPGQSAVFYKEDICLGGGIIISDNVYLE